MKSRFARLFHRACRLHPLSWLVMLGIFALFLWLNFNVSRKSYIEKHDNAWRGGLRDGFPIAWWDAGIESECIVQSGTLYLQSKPYGGWQVGGILCGLAVFSLSLVASAAASERVIGLLRPKTRELAEMDRRANRGVAIRPLTALLSVVLLAGVVTANMTLKTEPRDTSSAAAGFTQTMGWPFLTFLASEPCIKGMQVEGRSAAEIVHFLEAHPTTWWGRAHWYASGIVMNAGACLLLIVATAALSEWALRRESRLRHDRPVVVAPLTATPVQSDAVA